MKFLKCSNDSPSGSLYRNAIVGVSALLDFQLQSYLFDSRRNNDLGRIGAAISNQPRYEQQRDERGLGRGLGFLLRGAQFLEFGKEPVMAIPMLREQSTQLPLTLFNHVLRGSGLNEFRTQSPRFEQ